MAEYTVDLPADADIHTVIRAAGGNPWINRYDAETGLWHVDAPSQAAINAAVAAYDYAADHLARIAKPAKLEALAAEYASRVAAGCTLTVDGTSVTFGMDQATMLHILSEAVVAFNQGKAHVSIWDADEFWSDISGNPVTIGTADLAVATASGIRACFKACGKNYQALKSQIAAAADQAALDAIAITAGWPS